MCEWRDRILGELTPDVSRLILAADPDGLLLEAEWPPFRLPEDCLPLLAAGRPAFVRQNERIVSHGGASLEELVVPLVQIEVRES